VAAFVGDLLSEQNHPKGKGWVARPVSPRNFTGETVSYRTFTPMLQALTDLGLIEGRVGFQGWISFDGSAKLPGKGFASRFRATTKLLRLADSTGVQSADAPQHFIAGLPTKPLQLKGRSSYDPRNKVPGKRLPIDLKQRHAQILLGEVIELNEFFNQFALRGGTHRGFVRIFNNGGDPAYGWNEGGRLYSQGPDNFQLLSSAERLRMTIDGEPVCEIDIKASWLTIFHGWYDAQVDFSTDPYDRLGFGPEARDVVKAWFLATWGKGKLLTTWSKQAGSDYRKRTGGRKLGKDFPAKAIRDRTLEVYPLLSHLGDRADPWATLMWQESSALMLTMLRLKRDHSVPALSVHDSIIVRERDRTAAETLLSACYARATLTQPHLVTLPVQPRQPWAP